MRRSVAFVALLASTANADDPRDLFGLGDAREPPKPGPSCDDAHTFGCATATDPLDDRSPFTLSTWLSAAYLHRLPLANPTHDVVASYGLGAGRDEAGPTFGGATGLENRWTIEGAPTDSLRTGAADTRVPLSFLSGLSIRAGGFTARDRTSTGGVIDAELVRGGKKHVVETGVWVGWTAESRRRPIANGSYSVRRLTLDAGPDVSASVVASGPLSPSGAEHLGLWYAAGVAPTLTTATATWRASRLVDADDDGVPDGTPFTLLPIGEATDDLRDVFVPVMLRAGIDGDVHDIDLTLVGHGATSSRFLANATQQAAGIDRLDLIGDGIARWRGTWRNTRALAQVAWHRSDHRESPRSDAANGPQLQSAYVPMTLAEDPELARICHDGMSAAIAQCAVPAGFFASGGAGQLVDSVGDRVTWTAELAHRTGRHVLRSGATLEDTRLVQRSRLTGDEQVFSLFDGHEDRLRYYSGTCFDAADTDCNYISESRLRYRTRYAAAYLEDTFEPGERFRVDGGVRWELMWVGSHLDFSDQFAPRLGVAWDPLGGGRSRIWASMGRSFAMLPAGLGPTVIGRDATVHDVTLFGGARNKDSGQPRFVDAGIEPMSQDELTTGVELGYTDALRVVAWMQARSLGRGLETTPRGFENPGSYRGPPARRETRIFAVEVATQPTAKLALRAGYVVGETIGNFLGAYDPRQGAILYAGSDWNTDTATSSNELGALPTDLGHRVFVEASRRGRIAKLLPFEIATRLSLASGRPRNAFADADDGVVAVVPRGGLGRGPLLATANVRLATELAGLTITLDVLNAFDRDEPTLVDELYTDSPVRPIDGGTYDDLVFLKTVDGANPRRRPSYGLPIGFQGPISAALGIQRTF